MLPLRQDSSMASSSSLPSSYDLVGVFYNKKMMDHKRPLGNNCPEIPERLERTISLLAKPDITKRCDIVLSQKAEERHLLMNHSQSYIDSIQSWADDDTKKRAKTRKHLKEVYMSSGSFEAALYAVGSVVQASHMVFDGRLRSALAVVRPPGHHAGPCVGRGFCLLNNVAIAAKSLLNDKNAKKVLIVDWDVHFGDGTVDAFKECSEVLYFSLHRYDMQTYYPCDQRADYTYVGEGGGKHYTINVPFNNVICEDADYVAVWDDVLIPIVKEFKPEIILISGGFDAAVDDIAGYKVTPKGFAVLLRKLMDVQGKVVLALEGGYYTHLPECVHQCLLALLGDEIEESSHIKIKAEVQDMIKKVRDIHSQHWRCFAPTVLEAIDISSDPRCSVEHSGKRKARSPQINGSPGVTPPPKFKKHGMSFRSRRPTVPMTNKVPVGEDVRVSKKKAISRSVKAGIVFPVGRICRFMRKGGYGKRISAEASVYLAAVLQYLVDEVLTLAGDSAKDKKKKGIAVRPKKKRIMVRHIALAIMNDEELDQLCSTVIIPGGGVLPSI